VIYGGMGPGARLSGVLFHFVDGKELADDNANYSVKNCWGLFNWSCICEE
jgi:hypothetical protein